MKPSFSVVSLFLLLTASRSPAEQLNGTYNGVKLQGKLAGSQVTLSGKPEDGEMIAIKATLQSSVLSGTASLTEPADPARLTVPPPTGDSGFYGGNMDFAKVTDGATVYLPVSNPGALLYLGDAQAL